MSVLLGVVIMPAILLLAFAFMWAIGLVRMRFEVFAAGFAAGLVACMGAVFTSLV